MFKYGMRLRGFSLGCQPMGGLLQREDDPSGKYHDILVYDRELSEAELRDYELDDLNTDRVIVHIPLDSAFVGKLDRLLAAKKELIEKACGASLSVSYGEDMVSFALSASLEPEMMNAVVILFSSLCTHVRGQKRITVKPRAVANERYAMRTFLLRIGLIGPEYKKTRSLLLQNLSGDAAFAHGRPPRK